MKITIEHYNEKWTWEGPEDVTLDYLIDKFEKFLTVLGYYFDGTLDIDYDDQEDN